jgi:hypothetical protein
MSEKKGLVPRAIEAYLRTGGPDQPGRDSQEREFEGRQYVVLRNARGLLAVYRLEGDGGLRRLGEWPEALNEKA